MTTSALQLLVLIDLYSNGLPQHIFANLLLCWFILLTAQLVVFRSFILENRDLTILQKIMQTKNTISKNIIIV